MKHIIILGDGMADEPIDELGGKTPMQYADIPSMDYIARHGRNGLLKTVPDGFAPGSEIANLGILGYDVREVYEGRGSLEAASMGVDISDGEIAMRCNLICVADGKIKNHSAGHISTEEASELIESLQKELSSDRVSFWKGVSYRHLLKIKEADKRISFTPPHDVPGYPVEKVLPVAVDPDAEDTCRLILELMERSRKVLDNHPVNIRRVAKGQDPANMIWPWSPGYRPSMKTLKELYGIGRGAVISAVDLIKGIGVYAGLDVINVDGVTGLYDTNYEGKAAAAIDALKNGAEFVFLHVEASDEAGHEGDAELKIRTIEYLDSRVVKPILEFAETSGEPVSIAVLPDHPTPCRIKTHTSSPVPFAILDPSKNSDGVQEFSESAARQGSYVLENVTDFMKLLLS